MYRYPARKSCDRPEQELGNAELGGPLYCGIVRNFNMGINDVKLAATGSKPRDPALILTRVDSLGGKARDNNDVSFERR